MQHLHVKKAVQTTATLNEERKRALAADRRSSHANRNEINAEEK